MKLGWSGMTSSNGPLARTATLAVAATFALALSACGGGSGSVTVQPPPTASDAEVAINRITAIADSVIKSDDLEFRTGYGVPGPGVLDRHQPPCSVTACTWREFEREPVRGGGESLISLRILRFWNSDKTFLSSNK